MQSPTRSPFHQADLGGPFVAFAPKVREGDEDLSDKAYARHPLFAPSRPRRWSALALLIDALSLRRLTRGAASRSVRQDGE